MDELLPPVIAEPPKHRMHWVFIGPDGLRAGWGVVLFVLLYLVFILIIGWVFRSDLLQVRHVKALSVRLGLIIEITQCLPAILATWIMASIERRPLLAYGYQGPARAVRFLSGLVLGFVALSGFLLVLWKARLLVFDGQLLHGSAILKYALGWGLVFLLTAIFEESTLRGYLQFTLTRGIGFWWGALLLSLLFGFSHGTNPGETHVGLLSAAGDRFGHLPQPLVHGLALVGGRLSRRLGLGAILLLWHVGQRPSSAGTPVGCAPNWPAAMERRRHRPRRQPAGASTGRDFCPVDVAVVGTQSAVPLPRQRLETGLDNYR